MAPDRRAWRLRETCCSRPAGGDGSADLGDPATNEFGPSPVRAWRLLLGAGVAAAPLTSDDIDGPDRPRIPFLVAARFGDGVRLSHPPEIARSPSATPARHQTGRATIVDL